MFLRIHRRRLSFSVTALMIAVTAIAIILRFAPSLIPGSDGGRIYFSPDTLQTKWQHERLLVGTDIPISQTEFEYYRKDLVNYLIVKGYWTPRTIDNPRWIKTAHWNYRYHGGESQLHRQLSDVATQEWIDWCEAHPRIAALVWPRVIELLRSEAPLAESEVLSILWQARHSESLDEYLSSLESDTEYQATHNENKRHPTRSGGKARLRRVTFHDWLSGGVVIK